MTGPNGELIVSQSIWDKTPADAQAAMLRCTPPLVILTDAEWDQIESHFVSLATEMKAKQDKT